MVAAGEHTEIAFQGLDILQTYPTYSLVILFYFFVLQFAEVAIATVGEVGARDGFQCLLAGQPEWKKKRHNGCEEDLAADRTRVGWDTALLFLSFIMVLVSCA